MGICQGLPNEIGWISPKLSRHSRLGQSGQQVFRRWWDNFFL
jgi:hypothetical protein